MAVSQVEQEVLERFLAKVRDLRHLKAEVDLLEEKVLSRVSKGVYVVGTAVLEVIPREETKTKQKGCVRIVEGVKVV